LCANDTPRRRPQVLAIDRDATRAAAARQRALALGLDAIRFRVGTVGDLGSFGEEWSAAFPEDGLSPAAAERHQPHAVLALHACDTASDQAIAFGVHSRAHAVLVAPCCQAELAARWAAAERLDHFSPSHPFALVHRTPNLRREVASQVTDSLRVALLQASGYSVTCSEFVPVEHTPKNRLIAAKRLRTTSPSYRATRVAAFDEYHALKEATGGLPIVLEEMLGVHLPA